MPQHPRPWRGVAALNQGRLSNTILMTLFLLTVAVTVQAVPVNLSWTAPTDGAPVDHYNVYWSVEGDDFRLVEEVDSNSAVIEIEVGKTYHFKIKSVSEYDLLSADSEISDAVLATEEQQQGETPPATPDIRPNYPNPFNPQTTIRYGIPESHEAGMPAMLEIYSLRGQRVRMLQVNEVPGWHEVLWNGKDDSGETQPSGQYFLRLTAGGEVASWKMTMLK